MNQGTICAKVYPEGIQPIKGNNRGLIPARIGKKVALTRGFGAEIHSMDIWLNLIAFRKAKIVGNRSAIGLKKTRIMSPNTRIKNMCAKIYRR